MPTFKLLRGSQRNALQQQPDAVGGTTAGRWCSLTKSALRIDFADVASAAMEMGYARLDVP